MPLIQINQNARAAYNRELISGYIPENEHRHHVKWLRYSLDFCNKYKFSPSDVDSIPTLFLLKNQIQKNKIYFKNSRLNQKALRIYFELPDHGQQKNQGHKKPSQPIRL